MATATVTTVTSGAPLNIPLGLVFHPTASNLLFVANYLGNSISQIDTTGLITVTNLTLTGGTLRGPIGITIDSLGNLYVCNASGKFISKLVLTSGTTYSCTTLTLTGGTLLYRPYGITIDPLGNLYVCNFNGTSPGVISKLVLSSGTTYSCTTLTLNGPDTTIYPFGITIDSLGNLYVTNNTRNGIITANYISQLVLSSGTTYSSTTLTLTGGTLSSPKGITIDSNTGNLYIADSNTVQKIVLSGTNGTMSAYISSGLPQASFIAFNSSKYLYISDEGTNSVYATTSASCFNHDTKILCLNKEFQEQYLPIQDLRKGDIVKTYLHGYRKIDFIGKGTVSNKPHIWNECMYKMEKTETNGLLEDLIVTGGHAILVEQVTEEQQNAYEPIGVKGYLEKIDDKFLLLAAVSEEFVQLTDDEIYTYYHLVPENNGDDNQRFGIWANGILSETPSKNQFLNHEYQDM
jgi:sugar lactone lactonase YvrE